MVGLLIPDLPLPPPLYQVRTMSPQMLFLIDAFRNYTLQKYWKNFLLDTLTIQMVAKHIWIPNCLFERKEPQYNGHYTCRKVIIKGCVHYILGSLYCKSKRESHETHLFPFKSSFHSWDNQILTFQIFKCHQMLSVKHETHFTE